MANYSIKADLLKVKGAFVKDLKGRTGAVKRCLIIPIEDSGMFLGEKGCYLNMTAIEMREARYNDTLRQGVAPERTVRRNDRGRAQQYTHPRRYARD